MTGTDLFGIALGLGLIVALLVYLAIVLVHPERF